MRIEKWGFLLSYAIYLGFCIIFSVTSKDTSAVNTMIFAITIASTSFSISDLIFTKLDIDKKERESLFSLYHLNKYAKNFYINKLMEKYKDEADKSISILMELFDETEIDKIISGSLTIEEKENYLEKIKDYPNDNVKDCLNSFLESDDEIAIENNKDDEDDEKEISEMLKFSRRNEQIKYILASSIAVIGLIALLVILTVRIETIPYINSSLTGLAFLAAILNLLLKEYYKANSLKRQTEEKNKLIKDISSRIS